MKRWFILFYILLLGFTLNAETGHLVPREVFIGDEALFEFKDTGLAFTSFAGSYLSLPVEQIPESPFATIISVDYMKTDIALHVSVRFVPWVAGSLTLPPLPVLATFVQPPEVRIASILGRTGIAAPQNPREPLLVPGTTWLVYGFLAAFVCVVVLVLVFIFRFLPRLTGFSSRFLHNRNRRSTLRSIRRLERSISKTTRENWYYLFSRVMRRYFALCFDELPEFFFSYTTGEIVSYITSQKDESFAQSVAMLFSEIDIKRFCGLDEDDTRLTDATRARSLIHSLEARNV